MWWIDLPKLQTIQLQSYSLQGNPTTNQADIMPYNYSNSLIMKGILLLMTKKGIIIDRSSVAVDINRSW